ncbi:MAG: restriction endonuclease subunit S [Oscillospiraceae bacterium]|nr:restriction endonuclease subunit S [Oscillospiraceae bacterium]
MNQLKKLLQELCPDGVAYKELHEFLKIKNGSGYKNFGIGNIPVYGSGGIITYVDRYAYDKPSVLIPRKGSIDKLYYVEMPFWNVDTIFYTDIDRTKAIPKYVYHCLLEEHLAQYNTAGGVPSLTQKVLNKIQIPLPPLAVQEEIVRILDEYSEKNEKLIQELYTEIDLRKKQYAYYRDILLDFGTVCGEGTDEVKWWTLGEICKIKGRIGFRGYTRNDIVNKGQGAISFSPANINNQTIYYDNNTYISWEKYNESPEIMVDVNDILLCKTASIGKTAIVEQLPEKATINPQLVVLKNIQCNNRFLKYFLTTHYFQNELQKKKGVGSVPNISQKNLGDIRIPVPSLEEQERIVKILDRFDRLCNDLTSGLPAEINARQKQYEYYRNKLLNF